MLDAVRREWESVAPVWANQRRVLESHDNSGPIRDTRMRECCTSLSGGHPELSKHQSELLVWPGKTSSRSINISLIFTSRISNMIDGLIVWSDEKINKKLSTHLIKWSALGEAISSILSDRVIMLHILQWSGEGTRKCVLTGPKLVINIVNIHQTPCHDSRQL